MLQPAATAVLYYCCGRAVSTCFLPSRASLQRRAGAAPGTQRLPGRPPCCGAMLGGRRATGGSQQWRSSSSGSGHKRSGGKQRHQQQQQQQWRHGCAGCHGRSCARRRCIPRRQRCSHAAAACLPAVPLSRGPTAEADGRCAGAGVCHGYASGIGASGRSSATAAGLCAGAGGECRAGNRVCQRRWTHEPHEERLLGSSAGEGATSLQATSHLHPAIEARCCICLNLPSGQEAAEHDAHAGHDAAAAPAAGRAGP